MEAAGCASRIGLAGLAVMGQNLALNIAEKGFPISVYNRTASKTEETVRRAQAEGGLPLTGHATPRDFVLSIKRPRAIVMLVKAGAPVDSLISSLIPFLEPGDAIIDGGNEWYENTERRLEDAASKGLLYLGMGVSGGEDGARNGPSLMPGGHKEAYTNVQSILSKIAAQVDDGPCVTYVGPGGAGNFVKMVHNGVEYGDMQLISEAYDILKHVGGLSNAELTQVFDDWNRGELESFLVEITADIFSVPDDFNGSGSGEKHLVDKILDKTGMKGTGKWTVQQAAELAIAAPTIAASLDSRYISGLKDERVAAESALERAGLQPGLLMGPSWIDKRRLVDDVRQALYASKICSYAQGMNLIRAKSNEKGWGLNLGELVRIWKGGCIIRARFLDRIKKAYGRNPNLANLIVDEEFAREIVQRQAAWRRVVGLAVESGVGAPGMSASLAYFDAYRRSRLPANPVQAQRDYFGAHTYERVDRQGRSTLSGPVSPERKRVLVCLIKIMVCQSLPILICLRQLGYSYGLFLFIVSGNPQFRLLAVESIDPVNRASQKKKKEGQDGHALKVKCEGLTDGTGGRGSEIKEIGQRIIEPMTVGPGGQSLRNANGANGDVNEEGRV